MNKELKKNQRISLLTSFFLIIIGILLLLFPAITNIAPVKMIYVIFTLYSVIKLFEYFITKPKDDYEILFTSVACALAALSGFRFVNVENAPMVLSLTLASWIAVMSIIKLIKIDYYHDRKNGMMYVNLITFFFFLLLGLLTSVNLYFSEEVQYLMLGFFFVVNGLLDLSEDAIRILASKNIIKISDIK